MAGINASAISWNTANNNYSLATVAQTVNGVPQEAMVIYPGGNTTDMLNAVPPPPCDIVSLVPPDLALSPGAGVAQDVTSGTFHVRRAGYYLITIPSIQIAALDTSNTTYNIQLVVGSSGNSHIGTDSRHFVPIYSAQFFTLSTYVPLAPSITYTITLTFQQNATTGADGGGLATWTSILVQPLCFQAGVVPGGSAFVTT
jgi:hypothetical protein